LVGEVKDEKGSLKAVKNEFKTKKETSFEVSF